MLAQLLRILQSAKIGIKVCQPTTVTSMVVVELEEASVAGSVVESEVQTMELVLLAMTITMNRALKELKVA